MLAKFYAAAATLAHTALTTHASIADLVVEAGLMTPEKVAQVLSPERLSGMVAMTGPLTLPLVLPPN